MTVRRLREGEVGTLVDDLWIPFAEEMADLDSYNELDRPVREDAVAYRREQFADEDAATFVADDDGTLVGYVAVTYGETAPVFARGPKATVQDLYVVPERRGAGVGTRLLDRAEAWAAERGCEHVGLSVNAENDAALGLYESGGYGVRRYKMDKRVGE